MNDKEVIEILTAYSKYRKLYQNIKRRIEDIRGIAVALSFDEWIRTNTDSSKRVQLLLSEIFKLQDMMEEC